MSKSEIIPDKLLWVDLEMTGLNPQKDVILEIAAEVTDFEFNTLANYEARIKQNKKIVTKRMQENTWWRDFPGNRDDFIKKIEDGKTLKDVEQEMLVLVEKHFAERSVILAGNSIYNDRGFIKNWMPDLDLKLHYRMLDVSAWKVFMQGRYGLIYEKPDIHRAYDDIQASIAELQHYLDYLNK